MRSEPLNSRAGFTLIENLVALSVLLAFSAAVGPLLFQSRHILTQGNGRVAADLLLRSLIDAPFDREAVGSRRMDGEASGLSWRVVIEPRWLDTPEVPSFPLPKEKPSADKREKQNWAAYRVLASVSWGNGQSVSAETVRLGKAE